MNTVLDEVTSDAIDAMHVERRVKDWERRLTGLYRKICEWLPDDWEARRGAPVRMHERMMREFGVAARQMPTLELHGRTGEVVSLRPDALWIIGNNGRIDVKRDERRYLIVDAAENFKEPDWQAASAERRCDREAVTPDWLIRLLR
ncbi:MAG: hypothetical protein OXI95_02600 [bacterium]|nr:hypothetical protein [bacterium]MDE0415814.1 hypothetical protein [bacterium]